MQAASAEVRMELADKLGIKEQQLRSRLGDNLKLLPADVGPLRVMPMEGGQPWQALSKNQLSGMDPMMEGLPSRIDWGRQDVLTETVSTIMPGRWNLRGTSYHHP